MSMISASPTIGKEGKFEVNTSGSGNLETKKDVDNNIKHSKGIISDYSLKPSRLGIVMKITDKVSKRTSTSINPHSCVVSLV